MMSNSNYAADFDALLAICAEKRVAVQAIKSIARRRWESDDSSPRFSWYEPLRDPEALRRAVHYVMRKPGLFLNTSSDATLLRTTLEAASQANEATLGAEELSAEIEADVMRYGVEPLFIPGVAEGI